MICYIFNHHRIDPKSLLQTSSVGLIVYYIDICKTTGNKMVQPGPFFCKPRQLWAFPFIKSAMVNDHLLPEKNFQRQNTARPYRTKKQNNIGSKKSVYKRQNIIQYALKTTRIQWDVPQSGTIIMLWLFGIQPSITINSKPNPLL